MSGTISSGVGLLSGLPVQSIIDQLISIDARPMQLLKTRVGTLQTQRTTFSELNARLLGLKSSISRLDETSFFRSSRATSSDENVLTATAGESAVRGSFRFQVRSLVSNNQIISQGFNNADTQAAGGGTLTFEFGRGGLARATPLDVLNGGDGVRRGSVEITDSNGNKATVDLSTALDMSEIVDEINAQASLDVLARVEGNHLVLDDQGGGGQAVSVQEVGGGHTAADLGIAGRATTVGQALVGRRVLFLSQDTPLSQLNDGNGVSIGKVNKDLGITVGSRTFTVGLRGLLTVGDPQQAHSGTRFDVLNHGSGVRAGTFRITNRAGDTADIVVDGSVQTIGDVVNLINNAGVNVTASVGAATGQLVIRDDSTPSSSTANFVIEDVSGHAASDLGIVSSSSDQTFLGSNIYSVSTLGDITRAINFAVSVDANGTEQLNNVVQARVNAGGNGIELVTLSGTDEVTVGAGEGSVDSRAAEQLGLVGTSVGGTLVARDVLAGLNSVLLSSLRGGKGIGLGVAKFKASDGSQTTIDFGSASSVQDVLDLINQSTVDSSGGASPLSATLDDSGRGIVVVDASGDTGAQLKDISGSVVADLFGVSGGVASGFENGSLSSGNLQLQYVSRQTLMSELNNGKGVGAGSFTITTRDGRSASVSIGENQKTLGDTISLINSIAFDGLSARVNDNGDGIEIVDTTTGTGSLKIAGKEGSTAADLNLLGKATDFVDSNGKTQQRIDGSSEARIQISVSDTLNDIRDKINQAGTDLSATIINDGGRANPFHLIINSLVSGKRGQLVLGSSASGINFDTLVEAQDAIVFFGGAGSADPVVLTSSTNTLSTALDGISIDLVGASDKPVDLSITRNIDGIVTDLSSFVSSYNGVLDRLNEVTQFNADTQTRGELFGDPTVNLIKNRLRNVVLSPVRSADPGLNRLSSVGIRVVSGGKLSFDESVFRDLIAKDPAKVEALFTTSEDGLGVQLNNMLDELTRGFDGVLARKDELLQNREKLFNDRITSLQDQLDRKRARLQKQFQGLESSLAGLQGAQSSLAALGGSVSSAGGGLAFS